MKQVRLGIIASVFLLLLGVPAYHILHWENVLSKGTAYKFRIQPVDPYDAFSGRFVDLSFIDDTGTIRTNEFDRHDRAWCALSIGSDGFAKIARIGFSKPGRGDFVACRVDFVTGKNEAHVSFPFKRYYMNEKLAPRAAVVLGRTRTPGSTWAVVRVRKGNATIEGIYTEKGRIEDLLKRTNR